MRILSLPSTLFAAVSLVSRAQRWPRFTLGTLGQLLGPLPGGCGPDHLRYLKGIVPINMSFQCSIHPCNSTTSIPDIPFRGDRLKLSSRNTSIVVRSNNGRPHEVVMPTYVR